MENKRAIANVAVSKTYGDGVDNAVLATWTLCRRMAEKHPGVEWNAEVEHAPDGSKYVIWAVPITR